MRKTLLSLGMERAAGLQLQLLDRLQGIKRPSSYACPVRTCGFFSFFYATKILVFVNHAKTVPLMILSLQFSV